MPDDAAFFGKHPVETETTFIQAQPERLAFFTCDRLAGGPEAAAELAALADRLKATTDITKYRHHCGVAYVPPSSRGYLSINVLPELIGLPLNDLVLAWVASLRPSCIRVVTGYETCDAQPWRVTIHVDEADRVLGVSQEVEVGYGCGSDILACLVAAKTGAPVTAPASGFGHTAALLKVDF